MVLNMLISIVHKPYRISLLLSMFEQQSVLLSLSSTITFGVGHLIRRIRIQVHKSFIHGQLYLDRQYLRVVSLIMSKLNFSCKELIRQLLTIHIQSSHNQRVMDKCSLLLDIFDRNFRLFFKIVSAK